MNEPAAREGCSAAAIDWRASSFYRDAKSYHILPDYVVESAYEVMKLLGPRFGTFDIAETTESTRRRDLL